jgi:hypothetical protein
MIDSENVEPPRYPVFDDGNIVWKDESGSACQEFKDSLLQLNAFANRNMKTSRTKAAGQMAKVTSAEIL